MLKKCTQIRLGTQACHPSKKCGPWMWMGPPSLSIPDEKKREHDSPSQGADRGQAIAPTLVLCSRALKSVGRAHDTRPNPRGVEAVKNHTLKIYTEKTPKRRARIYPPESPSNLLTKLGEAARSDSKLTPAPSSAKTKQKKRATPAKMKSDGEKKRRKKRPIPK